MTVRPGRLWDQYEGKALAEGLRGSGRWPLQPHACALEPPWDAFDRTAVTMWDCMVNDWEGAWPGGILQQMFSSTPQIVDRSRPILLPQLPWEDPTQLVAVVIEQFPEDSSSIPKADQLLRSLPRLRRPASFEIVGVGPQPEYDLELARKFILSEENHRLAEAINGWTRPYTVSQFVLHEDDLPQLARLLNAHYPNSAVSVPEDRSSACEILAANGVRSGEGCAATLALAGPYFFPLRTFGYLDPDPLGVAIAAMEDLDKEEWAALQILFERAEAPWPGTLQEALRNPYRDEFFFNDISQKDLAEKFCSPLFAVAIRICASRRDVFKQLEGWAEQFTSDNQRLVFNETEWDENGQVPQSEYFNLGLSIEYRTSYRPGMLLNSNELASLVHLPSQAVVSERLRRTPRRTRPVAETTEHAGSVLIGQNVHRGKTRRARISANLRERHCYVAGASGTGKSTLLLNMILQDIAAGQGVGVLDPHGDLVRDVLQRIPEERINDVILFNPADEQFPIALNILEAQGEAERERIVAETLMSLEKYFPSAWGPRLERILTFTLYTVLDAIPRATLADVERMLIDQDFRLDVVDQCKNPRYVQFWEHEMPLLPRNAVDPVLNKISVFLLNPTVRNIICQRKSAIDFDRVLNGGQIFLANLSTGELSEKIAGTLGSFLVTKIVNVAFRRARVPEEDRRPWYLYVDEFQAFMNLSVGFERILAEARKYRLVLTMANQYVGQLSTPVRQAIFGNAGTMITFRLGVEDANSLAREMGVFTADEILSLELGEAIARAGGSSTAFNVTTFPPPPTLDDDPTGAIIASTRKRFARPRQDVEGEYNAEQKKRGRSQPPPRSKPGPKPKTKPGTPPDPDDGQPTNGGPRPTPKPPSPPQSADNNGLSRPPPDDYPHDPNEDDLVL